MVSIATYAFLVSDEFLDMGSLGFRNLAQFGRRPFVAHHLRAPLNMSQRSDIGAYLFSCSTGYESVKEVGKQHVRIVLGCVYCLVSTDGNDSVESVCIFDENTVLGVWTYSIPALSGYVFSVGCGEVAQSSELGGSGLAGSAPRRRVFFFRSVHLFFPSQGGCEERQSHPQDAEMFRDPQPARPDTKRAVGGRHCARVGGG